MLTSSVLVFLHFYLEMFKKTHNEMGTYSGSSDKICVL